VATCGTALAEEHFRLLRNFAKRIVLAYDADSAGQSATSRVYEWERAHEVDVAVVDLPEGQDPGELSRSDPDALRAAVAGARPFLQFRVENALAAVDLAAPEGRARGAEAALRAIAEHPDRLVRDQYVMTVGDRCRMEPELLRSRLEEILREPPASADQAGPGRRRDRPGESRRDVALPGSGGGAPAAGRPASDREDRGPGPHDGAPNRGVRPADPSAGPELEALRFMVHEHSAIAPHLDGVLFADEIRRRTYLTLRPGDALADVVPHVDVEVAELLRQLSVEEPTYEADSLGVHVESLVIHLVQLAANRAIAEDVATVRAVQDRAAMDTISRAKQALQELDVDDPGRCHEAVERLLAWLRGRPGAVGRAGVA
jgi:DNA primase